MLLRLPVVVAVGEIIVASHGDSHRSSALCSKDALILQIGHEFEVFRWKPKAKRRFMLRSGAESYYRDPLKHVTLQTKEPSTLLFRIVLERVSTFSPTTYQAKGIRSAYVSHRSITTSPNRTEPLILSVYVPALFPQVIMPQAWVHESFGGGSLDDRKGLYLNELSSLVSSIVDSPT